jgi:hypothetical protein
MGQWMFIIKRASDSGNKNPGLGVRWAIREQNKQHKKADRSHPGANCLQLLVSCQFQAAETATVISPMRRLALLASGIIRRDQFKVGSIIPQRLHCAAGRWNYVCFVLCALCFGFCVVYIVLCAVCFVQCASCGVRKASKMRLGSGCGACVRHMHDTRGRV